MSSVTLPHTGMTAPHDRLTLRNLHTTQTPDGETYTAELLLDGEPVGAVENKDPAGATTWFPLNRELFGWTEMAAYVAGCTTAGEEMVEEFVLDELFEEASAWLKVTACLADGKTPVRTLRHILQDGEPTGSYAAGYIEVPGPDRAKDEKRGQLARTMWEAFEALSHTKPYPEMPYTIQVWTGEAWVDLVKPGTGAAIDARLAKLGG